MLESGFHIPEKEILIGQKINEFIIALFGGGCSEFIIQLIVIDRWQCNVISEKLIKGYKFVMILKCDSC